MGLFDFLRGGSIADESTSKAFDGGQAFAHPEVDPGWSDGEQRYASQLS